jgi:hypothetical protein
LVNFGGFGEFEKFEECGKFWKMWKKFEAFEKCEENRTFLKVRKNSRLRKIRNPLGKER